MLRNILNRFNETFNCCSQPCQSGGEMQYQRAQRILFRLKKKTERLSRLGKRFSEIHSGLDSTSSAELKFRRRGRVLIERFKQLDHEKQAKWIEFHNALVETANRIVTETELHVQSLQALKQSSNAIAKALEGFPETNPATREHIRSLRDIPLAFASSIVTDGRIRSRYLKILCMNHNDELCAQWKEQLNRELDSQDVVDKYFTEFLTAARAASKEVSGGISPPSSANASREIWRNMQMLKAKRSLLSNLARTSHNQATKWRTRVDSNIESGNPRAAEQAEHRWHIWYRSATLYSECLTVLDALYDTLAAYHTGCENRSQTAAG